MGGGFHEWHRDKFDGHGRYRSIDMPMKNKLAEFKFDGESISLRGIKQAVKGDVPKDYIASKDAYRILGVSPPTLWRWYSQGKLGAIKRGNVWYYLRQDLLSIIKRL